MSITADCMTVNLNIGIWTGHRLDKEATKKVIRDANATDGDAARVNKHLIPKESLRNVVAASNSIRTHFYTKTLPWKDNGDRVLTRKMYQSFIEEHGRLEKEFHAAVDTFLGKDYLAAVERAGFRMGTMFKSSDYPPVRELQRKFYVNLDIDAVTEAGDFRVEMDDKQKAAIQKEMEMRMRQRLGKAMQEVWERLATTLGHFASKMEGDEIFRNSTVANLEEIVKLLPDLNILEDANLERIRRDIENNLVGFNPNDLRGNKEVRSIAATQAKRIMDEMSGFMNAFGKAAE